MSINKNFIAGAKYELLAWVTHKKRRTVRTYFNRNCLDINNANDVKQYLNKYFWKSKNDNKK